MPIWSGTAAHNTWNDPQSWYPVGVPSWYTDAIFDGSVSQYNCNIDVGHCTSIITYANYTGTITQNSWIACSDLVISGGTYVKPNDYILVTWGKVVIGESGRLDLSGGGDLKWFGTELSIHNSSGRVNWGTSRISLGLESSSTGMNIYNPHPANAFNELYYTDAHILYCPCDESGKVTRNDRAALNNMSAWDTTYLTQNTSVPPALKYPRNFSVESLPVAGSAGPSLNAGGGSQWRTPPFTVAFWVFLNKNAASMPDGWCVPLGLHHSSSPWWGWFIQVDPSNRLVLTSLDTTGSGITISGNIVSTGVWTHVAATCSPPYSWELWQDGVSVGSVSVATGLYPADSYLRALCDWAYGGRLDGRMSEINFWRKVLSSGEIRALASGYLIASNDLASGAGLNLQSNLTVGNAMYNAGGIVNYGSYTISVTGNYYGYGGIPSGTGGIVLSGTGRQDFFSGPSKTNLSIKNTSATGVYLIDGTNIGTLSANALTSSILINFGTSWAHSVDTFQLTGTGSNYVKIRSTTDGVQHTIYGLNPGNQTNVDVKDSNLLYAQQKCVNSINSGNNSTNWFFGTGLLAYCYYAMMNNCP